MDAHWAHIWFQGLRKNQVRLLGTVCLCARRCAALFRVHDLISFRSPVKEIRLNLFSKEATEGISDLHNITQLVRSLGLGLNPFIPAVPPHVLPQAECENLLPQACVSESPCELA